MLGSSASMKQVAKTMFLDLQSSSDHFVVVFVSDKNDTCGNGEVRLIGGKTEYEGTVEICLGGQWGSICHFGWDVNDANVLCNQLGYSSTGNSALYAAFFGQSSGPIFLDNVRCVGSEPSLSDCPVEASPRTFCTHFQDAAVRCLPKGKKDICLPLFLCNWVNDFQYCYFDLQSVKKVKYAFWMALCPLRVELSCVWEELGARSVTVHGTHLMLG